MQSFTQMRALLNLLGGSLCFIIGAVIGSAIFTVTVRLLSGPNLAEANPWTLLLGTVLFAVIIALCTIGGLAIARNALE